MSTSKKHSIEELKEFDSDYSNTEPPLKKAKTLPSKSVYKFSHKTQEKVFDTLIALKQYQFIGDLNIFYLITLYSTGIFAHCFRRSCDKQFVVYDLKLVNKLINNEYYIIAKDEFVHFGQCLLCGYHGNEWGYCSQHYPSNKPDFMGVIRDNNTQKIIICRKHFDASMNPCSECSSLIPGSEKLIFCGKCDYGPFCEECASEADSSQDYCFRGGELFCCAQCLANLSEGEQEY